MAIRVTDFRIDVVEIDEAKFYRLPPKARKLIEAYASPLASKTPGIMRFELPIYRWDEINAAMGLVAGPEPE